MPSPKLLTHYHALEPTDKITFQKRARLLQSIWREEQGYKPSESHGKTRGATLEMPWAKETLANYLTDTIREVVRAEVLDPTRSAGKLYGQPRSFNNLLSSQPHRRVHVTKPNTRTAKRGLWPQRIASAVPAHGLWPWA